MSLPYAVVDAFSSTPLLGNPVFVVFDADGLDAATMQAVARWTNLSETTFVLSPTEPGADYRLRIFMPEGELPFAGHPTLGSAHALIRSGRVTPRDGRLVQQCAAGLIDIATAGDALTLTVPEARMRAVSAEDRAALEAALGAPLTTDPAVVDVGAVWLIASLADRATLTGLRPDLSAVAAIERRLEITGVTVFAPSGEGDDIEVRSFCPASGANEDPVCGSGNGATAAYRHHTGLLPADGARYLARQGRCVGRDGFVQVSVDGGGRVTIGGACITVAEGALTLST